MAEVRRWARTTPSLSSSSTAVNDDSAAIDPEQLIATPDDMRRTERIRATLAPGYATAVTSIVPG
jgi:hypothetical protein